MQQQTETALEENIKIHSTFVAFCPAAFCPVAFCPDTIWLYTSRVAGLRCTARKSCGCMGPQRHWTSCWY